MTTKAPDFQPGYPSLGARIGPAWSAVWDHMADGRWRQGQQIAQDVKGDLAAKTITNLLSKAASLGLLQRRTRYAGSPQPGRPVFRAEFRRADLPEVEG